MFSPCTALAVKDGAGFPTSTDIGVLSVEFLNVELRREVFNAGCDVCKGNFWSSAFE